MAFPIPGARPTERQLSSPNTSRSRGRPSRSARGAALTALSLALLAGCGGSAASTGAREPEPAPAPASQEPFDLEKALAREASGLSARDVRTAAWSVRALAAGAPRVVEKDKMVSLSIPIGTASPVECFVYSSMLDSGEAIRQFIQLLDPGKAEIARIQPWEASVHRESPAMFVQALYLAATERGKAAGLLKIAMHADRAHPIACVHDELGYVRTFERLSKELFDSLEARDARPKPEYTETLILRVGEVPIGFETSDLLKDEGGQRRWFTRATMLAPTDPKTLRIEDEASNVLVDAAGRLRGGVWIESSEGKANHRIELSQKANFQYEYSGEVEGKKVQGTFSPAAKAWLPSPIGTASALARLLKKKGSFDFKQQEYAPSIDPTKPVDVRYQRDASGTVSVSVRTMRLVGSLAPDGRPESFEVASGPPKLTLQRAYVRGKL
ncbi:hypothetical protein WMF31_18205 [Sorangium sp. So ce1036]|uniref:hypothetical protein n=1 Tax=Sorangium sp. So ce1036 TaxID=3133328 RepID=UPI003F0FDD4C